MTRTARAPGAGNAAIGAARRGRSSVGFRELQRRNRRRSFLLAAALLLVMAALGTVLGATWGSWLVGLGAGLLFAVLQYGFARSAGSAVVLKAMRATPIDRREDPQLVNVVEEVAIAAGIPCPTIYLMQDPAPNAFATGFKPENAAVAITTGLREKLSRDELAAVMAHEIGHIRNGDTGYMVLMAVLVGAIALLADIGLRSLWYGGRGRSRGKGGRGAAPLLILVLVLAIVAPIVSRILQAAVSRQREYLADATSVELTRQPNALCSALQKLTSDTKVLAAANRATQHLFIVNPMRRARAGGGMMRTHPPVAMRIQRIRDSAS